MPLPLFAWLGIAAAGYGGKKILDAKKNMNEAKDINEQAKNLAQQTEYQINDARESTNSNLVALGKRKMEILSGSIAVFVREFSKIKNVNLQDSVGLEELRGFNPDSKDFLDMKTASFKVGEIATGGLGSVGAGALAAYGAYSAVGTLAAASTGTAISTLGGAAATNATLAWLGGGSLAAGGMGVTGGMAVLGGLVAGPALAVGGAFMAAKAEKALNDAKTNHDQARKFNQEGKNICSLLSAISKRSQQIEKLLVSLDRHFSSAVEELAGVIQHFGDDWNGYTKDEKFTVGKAAQLAKTVKVVLDTSLLRENGSLNSESEKMLEVGEETLAKIEGREAEPIARIEGSSGATGNVAYWLKTGYALLYGRDGAKQEPEKAKHWFEMAAEAGNEEAMIVLADKY